MRTRTVIPFFILTLLLFSCNGAKKTAQKEGKDPLIEQGTSANAQPPLIVYKTRADYTKNVPVLLSCDKTHIVSFPHPKDLKQGGKFRYPKRLSNGYLLDEKGITKDVAFLEYTYEAYAALTTPPSADSLFWKILDKHPLTAFCVCGSRLAFDGDLEALAQRINNGECHCRE